MSTKGVKATLCPFKRGSAHKTEIHDTSLQCLNDYLIIKMVQWPIDLTISLIDRDRKCSISTNNLPVSFDCFVSFCLFFPLVAQPGVYIS